MGETSSQIERHIQETRNDLSNNITELEDRVKTAVDWRAQFEERPGTLLAIAFAGGVLLSALLPSRRSSRRGISAGRPEATVDSAVSASALIPRAVKPDEDAVHEALATWGAVKGALIGVATTKLGSFVEDLVPGFREEFTRARKDRTALRSAPSSGSAQAAWQKSAAAGAD